MAKFVRLEKSKQYLNLDFVSLVTQQDDDSVRIEFADRRQDEVIKASDAENLLLKLKKELEQQQ